MPLPLCSITSLALLFHKQHCTRLIIRLVCFSSVQVTVWKNLSNFVTALGDVFIFGTWQVLALLPLYSCFMHSCTNPSRQASPTCLQAFFKGLRDVMFWYMCWPSVSAGKSYTWPVWGTLFMMLGSAVVGATTDVRFTWHGYGWQLANCLFTSAYALYLRSVMDKV